MDALSLDAAEATRRIEAISRLQAVAADMVRLTDRIIENRTDPALALGPLASAARAGWSYAQCALIQAQAGMASPRMIEAIALRDPQVSAPSLRRLSLSTLIAAEARLHRRPPEPAPVAMEAAR